MGRMEDDDDVGMGESDEEARHLNAYTSGDDDDDSEFDETIPLNENGRLRMRSDINMEGPAYAGKKSSRSAVFENTDEEKLQEAPVDDDDDDDDNEDDDDDLHLLEREYEELRKQEVELVNKLKRKRTDDQGKGDSVRHQRVLWDRALEIRISMQKLLTGANQLPEVQGKLALCKSDSQCEKAYDSLTKSAVAALDCFLELKEALIEQNSGIGEAGASNMDAEKPGKKRDDNPDSLWNRMDAIYSRFDYGMLFICGPLSWSESASLIREFLGFHLRSESMIPYRNASVDRWQRKTQLATGAAAVKGRFQAFNQSISQQLASALRNPTQLMASIRSSQSKEQVSFSLVENDGSAVAASDITDEEASTCDVEVVDDSEFYQQLLVEFLESSNPGGLGGIQRRQHTKKRKVVDCRASKGRKIRYNILEPLVNFMAPEPMELPPMTSKLFLNLFGQRTTPVF